MFDLISDALHSGSSALGLGTEYLFNGDSHSISVFNESGGAGGVSVTGHAGGGVSPAATLVGNANGLQIDLIWDSSVTSAANWRQIESAVISAAAVYTTLFTNHAVLNIGVGFGEVDGFTMGPNAVGESLSAGYVLTQDDFGPGVPAAIVAGALGAADTGLVQAGLMSADAAGALENVPGGANVFITAAEAKALGLVDPTAGIDGFIGLSNSVPMAFGPHVPSTSFDAFTVAAHEISEVMGRVGLVGASLGPFTNLYTPLDSFRYSAPGVLAISPGPGDYFSLNDGASSLLPFNNPSNGGDAADWATSPLTKGDAFNAFGPPGPEHLSLVDLLAVSALGYQVGLH
jgi:hypothetical protein